MAWDKQVICFIRKTLLELVDRLVAVWPSYFNKWRETSSDPADPSFEITGDNLYDLAEYIESHGSWDRRNAADVDLERSKRLDLHAAEADAIRQLRVTWDKIAEEEPDDETGARPPRLTMIEVSSWYGWHFA